MSYANETLSDSLKEIIVLVALARCFRFLPNNEFDINDRYLV